MGWMIALAVLMPLSFVLCTCFLWLASKIIRAPQANWTRAMIASSLMLVVGVVCTLAQFVLIYQESRTSVGPMLIGLLVSTLAAIGLSWTTIKRAFDTTWIRSFGVFIAYQVFATVVVTGIAYPLRWYAYEAYFIPTNSSAPALLGRHYEGTCPHCQGRLTIPYHEHQRLTPKDGPQEGICLDCRRIGSALLVSEHIADGDRIMVDKLIEVRRWDFATYKTKLYPNVTYVHRVVALPGETLSIVQGKIHINGKPIAYPPDMEGLKYEPPDRGAEDFSLTEDHDQVVLANDEYFVIGDFSKRSMDSRFEDEGPIKKNAITGVVTTIYWPPSRWRSLR